MYYKSRFRVDAEILIIIIKCIKTHAKADYRISFNDNADGDGDGDGDGDSDSHGNGEWDWKRQ